MENTPSEAGASRVSLPSIANTNVSTNLKRQSSYFNTKKYVLPTLHPELNGYQPGEFTLRVTNDVSKGLGAHMDRMKRKQAKTHVKRMDSLVKSINLFDAILQQRRQTNKNLKVKSEKKSSNGAKDLKLPLSRLNIKKSTDKGLQRFKSIDYGSSQSFEFADSEDSFGHAASDHIILQLRKDTSRSPDKKYTQEQVDYIFRQGYQSKAKRKCSEGVNMLNAPIPNLNNSRRASLVSIKELERFYDSPQIRFRHFGDARNYFIRAIRKVMYILFWWSEFSSKYETIEAKMKTFLDMAQELADTAIVNKVIDTSTGVKFDLRDYKASHDFMLTREVLLILCTRPEQRSDEQVQKVIRALQGLKSYAEYPIHMQVKLAKVAFYEEVSPKRIILRQGHLPENFYFILSGSAIVKVITCKDGVPSVNNVSKLEKGQSFGEIALLHDSVRTATVESTTDMQLLSVYKDDFMDIFFNMKDGEDPQHITFCREIPFLKAWPLDELIGDPSSCVFHYFRRGSVVVPDSQHNEWIYIVKSGSCRVLKRLRGVDAYKPWKNGQSLDSIDYQNRVGVSSEQVAKIDSGKYNRRVLAVKSPVGRAMTNFFMTSMKVNLQGDFQSRKSKSSVSFRLGKNKEDIIHGDELHNPDLSQQAIAQTLESNTEINPIENKARISSPVKKCTDLIATSEGNNTTDMPGFSKSQFRKFLLNFQPYRSSLPSIQKHPPSAATSKYIHSSKAGQPCFITLKKLRPKEVFGLEDVQFEDEQYDNPKVSVILVSDGSELIMISKKKFIEHANEFVRQYVREHVQFYPEDKVLQRSLQTEVNWDLYKEETMTDTLKLLQDMNMKT